MTTPRHISLRLEHNPHRTNYETVPEYIEHLDLPWVNDAEKAASIASDEMWEMTWYPNTPVGFLSCAAFNLDALLEHVKDWE